jgi:hypothetical protein
MSLAPTSAARVKMPVSPKTASTQLVASETATNMRAKISAVINCNGFAAGIARSSAEPGATLFHSHQEIARRR